MFSNLLISAFRKCHSNGVRMPALHCNCSILCYCRSVYHAGVYTKPFRVTLGVYIPLIVVNCIILGKQNLCIKNQVIPSAFDGLGMGLGLRSVWYVSVYPSQIFGATLGITIFHHGSGSILSSGIFLVAGMNCVREAMEKKGKPLKSSSGCLTGDCKGCDHLSMCTGKLPEEKRIKEKRRADK